jgi:uncharacterized repeat protein (TIGR04052 family)
MEIRRMKTKLLAAACLAALGLAPVACGEDENPEGTGARAGSAGQAGSSGRGGSGGTGGSSGSAGDAGPDAGRQSVTINFKAKVGQDDFACGRSYPAQGSTSIRAQSKDLRFYVEELKLVTPSGVEVPVVFDERLPWQTRDVAYLDFEDGTGACAGGNAQVNRTITGTVAAGTYNGVTFVNGVPESLNHADPTTLPAPLQAPTHWEWLSGFRFFIGEMVEVPADAGADSDAGSDAGAAALGIGVLHLGSTKCTRTFVEAGPDSAGDGSADIAFSCANPNRTRIKLTGYDPSSSSIVVDVGALFGATDLRAESRCHSSSTASCTAIFARIGLDYASGTPLAAQQVYRIE